MSDTIGRNLIKVGGSPCLDNPIVQAVLNSHPEIYGGLEFDLLPDPDILMKWSKQLSFEVINEILNTFRTFEPHWAIGYEF